MQIRERCHPDHEHPSRGARACRWRDAPADSLTRRGWPTAPSCSASSAIRATASRRRWCAAPTGRSSRCRGCCTSSLAGSTATATTRPSPDWSAQDLGQTLNADQVRYLITAKLLPLGILAVDGAPARLPRANPCYALRARGTLLPERAANAVGMFFRPLFRWPVIVAVLVSVAAMDYWIFAVHGLTAGTQQVLRDPVDLVVVFALFVGSGLVPRIRARGGLPLRRRAVGPDRRRHLPGVAVVLHQRHRLVPAQPRRPAAHRPRRPVLQPDLHPGPGGSLRGHLVRDPAPRHRHYPPGDARATAAVRSLRRLLHSQSTSSVSPTCSLAWRPS